MWGLMNDHLISIKIVEDLFAGIESDLNKKVQLNNKKDLLIYSYRVAGTVGLMMAKIFNVKNKNSMKAAIDLGIAMQLTNIARDVVEDSKINRFYIRHDFETIKDTLTLADLFYKTSFTAIKEIPFQFRFAILVARRVYKKIGDKILRTKNIENYNKGGKIYVNSSGKVYQTIMSLFDLIILLLIKKETSFMNKEHLLINEEIDLDERI
jgi:phytoene synthase